MSSIPFISDVLLRELVPMQDAIDAVRDAFVSVSKGNAWQPQRLVSNEENVLVMAANRGAREGTVVKVVSIHDERGSAHGATLTATALWVDGATGEAVAVIDGSTLTAIRTGAASGVATDALAPSQTATLALFGAGAQAADQARAVCAVRPIETIRIASRTSGPARRLADALGAEYPHVEVVVAESADEAVHDADVICCATTSTTPLFARSALKDRTHINAIGAFRPSMCELDPSVLEAATVVAIDEISATLEEAGDIIQAIDAGRLTRGALRELGDVLAQESEEQHGVTVFKSVGIAMQDWCVARLAVERMLMPAEETPALARD